MVLRYWELSARIISDYYVPGSQMRPLNTPTDSSRNARYLVHGYGLVVHGAFVWTHLVRQEPSEGWLVDTILWILQGFILNLFESFLVLGRQVQVRL